MFRETRIGKKKRLTARVALINFRGQTQERQNRPSVRPTQTASPTILTKKEPKILTSPTGQLKSDEMISIEVMKKKESEKNESENLDFSNRPTDAFTPDELKMHWRKYAFSLQNSEAHNASSAFGILSKRNPELNGDIITFTVDNSVLYDIIMEGFAQEIINYLRKKLNNWSIKLELKLEENIHENPQAISGTEKYQLLAKKNINLVTLSKTFNLDIDY